MTIGPPSITPSRPGHRGRRLRRGAIGFAALLVAVEAVTRVELVDPDWLPPASTVLATTMGLLVDPAFLIHVGGTLLAALTGLALATAIGVTFGAAIARLRRAGPAMTTAVELLRPIPSVALIAPAILVLGRGLDLRIVLVAYAATWPILINAITGVRGVDPLARETARAFGLSRAAVIRDVDLPSAAPFIATGVRISAGIALIVAISAELIAGGPPGIGVWMLEASQSGVPRELAYAGIVVAGLLSVGVNTLLVAGERRLVGWHPRLREDGA